MLGEQFHYSNPIKHGLFTKICTANALVSMMVFSDKSSVSKNPSLLSKKGGANYEFEFHSKPAFSDFASR